MTTYPIPAMSRASTARPVPTAKLKTAAAYVGLVLFSILIGAAYASTGYYLAVFLDAFGVPGFWQQTATHAWVAIGAAGLTVWVLRFADIDVRRRRSGVTR